MTIALMKREEKRELVGNIPSKTSIKDGHRFIQECLAVLLPDMSMEAWVKHMESINECWELRLKQKLNVPMSQMKPLDSFLTLGKIM